MMQRRMSLAVVTGILMSLPAFAVAAPNIVLPRPGQVGIGIQGQFGMLAKSGDLGDLFSNGPGIGIRLRYRMRYERAIGLSFEAHQFDSRVVGVAGDTTIRKLKLITSGVEIYQLFGTRDRTTRMVSVGVGLAQASVELNDGETIYPDDGVYVSAGAGLEHFFFRSWAYDLSTRYFAVFQHGKTNHDFQAQLGLIFYASY
jgi:hypothetical protein